MRHGSLFSGIGGFDLAADWMGWENVFHCEWNEFGKRVLKHFNEPIKFAPTQTPQNPLRCRCTHGEPDQEGAEVRQFGNACTGYTDGVRGAEVAGAAADTCGEGCEGVQLGSAHNGGEREQNESYGSASKLREVRNGHPGFDNFPTTQPTFRHRDDVLPDQLVGITFSKWRNSAIAAMGNAIVPQVALQIFKAIQQYENQ